MYFVIVFFIFDIGFVNGFVIVDVGRGGILFFVGVFMGVEVVIGWFVDCII